MVQDKVNKIYTELMEYMESLYPNIQSGRNYPDKVPQFPYVYFFQMDAPTVKTTLSNTEDVINLAFQIEVYSNKGENLARKISTDIREYMVNDGFFCRTFRPVQSASNISRFVMRYERLDV